MAVRYSIWTVVTVSFVIVWHVIGDENQISILKLGVNSAVLKDKGFKFNVFFLPICPPLGM